MTLTEMPTWHAGSLLQLSGSYWQTFTLHAGVKLDIFTLLSKGPQNAEQVSRQLDLDLRGTTMLLNALAAMHLLKKKGDLYDVTDPARRFLDQTSSHYIGYMIMHHHHLAESWTRLDEAVRTGRPLRSRASDTDEKKREAFLMGMYNIASQQAPEIASLIDFGNCEHLLDLGGGPGTYAIHFCKQNPQLKATVFDLPTTRPFAEKTINRHDLSDRIKFVDGNFIHDPFQGSYDAAWLSHILHAEGPETCERIISNVVQALTPGGIILIHEFILDDAMDGPLFPALFSLNMLQGTEQGQSYSQNDIAMMLERTGMSQIERLEYCGPTESGILQGVRS